MNNVTKFGNCNAGVNLDEMEGSIQSKFNLIRKSDVENLLHLGMSRMSFIIIKLYNFAWVVILISRVGSAWEFGQSLQIISFRVPLPENKLCFG